MANPIGILFAMIAVILLLFFGMGATTGLINDANVTTSDANYDNFQTAQKATTAAYSVAGVMPYILVLAFLIVGLVLLMSVMRR
jgi:amino acid transporter